MRPSRWPSATRAVTWVVALCVGLAACGPGGAPDATDRDAAAAGDTDTAQAAPTVPSPAPPPDTQPAPAHDSAVAGEQLPAERAPRGAYVACQDSVAATLPDPEGALWGDLPDNVKPTGEPGRYAVLAQVRPDTLSAGVSYACVVERTDGGWRVLSLQTQPSSGTGAPP